MLSKSQELRFFIGVSKIFRVHSCDDWENCTCMNPECANVGKHPAEIKGLHDAVPFTTNAQLELFKTRNVGIVCGDVLDSCGFGFLVVDVDPRNNGESLLREWEREHGPLPPTWTVATGGGGWHYYYKITEKLGSRKFSSRGIEVQGYGSYVLAPTSWHVSGKQYEWDDAGHPDDVPLADAPDWLVEMCRKKDIDTSKEDVQQINYTEFKNVLAYLQEINPDCVYSEWIAIGMALHSTGYGRDAFNAWQEWSRRGKKHKDGECSRMWRGFKNNPQGYTHETVYYYANKEIEPFEFPEQEEEQLVEDTTDNDETTQRQLIPMPDGLLGDMARFIAANAYRRHDVFAIEAACMVIASLAQRTFLVNGAQMNLYSILVAPPASGKNDYLEITREILMHCKSELIMSQPASEKGLRVLLQEEPSRLWIQDEQLHWLIEATSPKSISKHLLADVLSLWGRVRLMPGSRARKKEDSISDIKEPKLSWLGTGTFSQMTDLMKTDANSTGLLSRLNFITSDQKFFGSRRSKHSDDVPTSLITELNSLWTKPFIEPGDIKLRNLQLDRDAKWLMGDLESQVDKFCDEFAQSGLPESASPIALRQRNVERTLRYAGIRCLSRRGEIVSGPDVAWATRWVDYTSQPIVMTMKRESFSSKWDDRLSRVESQLRDAGRMSWGDFLRKNRRIKRAELNELLETLIEVGTFTKSTTARGTYYTLKT